MPEFSFLSPLLDGTRLYIYKLLWSF